MKIKTSQIEAVRVALTKRQGGTCALCGAKLGARKQPVLDHCHVGGHIRDVLCRNCNGLEGKVWNLSRRSGIDPFQWLQNLDQYWDRHKTSQHGLIHPTFKTEAEKRDIRNAKARAKRAALKARK